ncbi:MAG: photoactive yellow protein [Phycisphaerales bacterium]
MSATQRTAAPITTSFVPDEVLEQCSSFTRADMDALPFGVVKCDDSGRVELYSRWETEMSGVPADQAEGRNFFTDVSPCANNGLFFGTFKKGVAASSMNVLFPYTFTYRMRPTNVRIHLYRDEASGTNYVFVAKS